MSYHHHRRTYTRTVLFAETFDFPTPPTSTWGTSETASVSTDAHSEQCGVWQPLPPTPLVIKPAKRISATSAAAAQLDKPLPRFPPLPISEDQDERQDHASGTVTGCPCCEAANPRRPQPRRSATTSTSLIAPTTASISRWSICSDDTEFEAPAARPLSPSSSIHQRIRRIASSSSLRNVTSPLKLRLKVTLQQLTMGRKSLYS